jgi:hypothetical protein
VKVAAITETTHNPSEELHWVSCLRENLTSSSYGEELETGPAARSGTAPAPYPTRVQITYTPSAGHKAALMITTGGGGEVAASYLMHVAWDGTNRSPAEIPC